LAPTILTIINWRITLDSVDFTQLPTDGIHPVLLEVICRYYEYDDDIVISSNYDVIVMSLPDYEGVSEVWQLVPSDMFSLITIPFQGRAVKVGVSNDDVM